MNLLEIVEKVIPVLLAGLFFGAGLPAFYAVGVRLLSGTTEYTADGSLIEIEPPNAIAKAIAYIIFGIVAIVIVVGILWIAQGFIEHVTGVSIFGA